MCHNILTVGVRENFLHQITDEIRKMNGCIIEAPDLSVASWLLEQRRFSAALIDLNCMFDNDHSFWTAVERFSLTIIVVGPAGSQYHWPVKRASDRFFSYDISPQELIAYIAALL